jgi:hypothetical protein
MAPRGDITIKSRITVNCKKARMAITNTSYPEKDGLGAFVDLVEFI